MTSLREALDAVPAVDHHAHLLGRGYRLEEVLTESHDATRVRDHPAYAAALRELEAFRNDEPLARACGIGLMLVDDGFRFPGALSLDEHVRAVGCPVRRVLRIETLVEDCTDGWPAFNDVRDRVRAAVTRDDAVALKTIAAYRCGLDLPAPDEGEAREAYGRWKSSGRGRLEEAALIAFFIREALVARPLPLQVHTGIGDADLALHRADPSLLKPLIEEVGTPIVLLHCYPFVSQASWLAGTYPQVYLDLSLAVTLVAHRRTELVLNALDLAPASKILFGTDASRVPEAFYLGARWWRDALAHALPLVADERTAVRWGELILAGNAREVYAL